MAYEKKNTQLWPLKIFHTEIGMLFFDVNQIIVNIFLIS